MARSNTKERNKSETKAPAYIAYHVTDGEKAYWTRIGVLWSHNDGKGFNFDYNLVPVNGGRIVLRVPGENENGKGA